MATLAIRDPLSVFPVKSSVGGNVCRGIRRRPTQSRDTDEVFLKTCLSSKPQITIFKRLSGGYLDLRLNEVFTRADHLFSRSRNMQVCCIITEKIVGGSQLSTHMEANIRRLILLRHAKSSWTDRSLRDHDRPLSKRGRQAAASISSKLQHHPGWFPQLVLCSDSMRTRETLDVMQQHLQELAEAEVRFLGSFYSVAAMDGQTAEHLQEIICKYSSDDVTTIMCMGHNRGWEEAATLFSGVHVELKTANAALLEAYGNSWREAFDLAGLGGWRLQAVVKPDTSDMEEVYL